MYLCRQSTVQIDDWLTVQNVYWLTVYQYAKFQLIII